MFLRRKQNERSTDDQLVKAVKAGRTEALGVLWDRYAHLLFGVGMKYLKNTDTAKDAVMTVFAELPRLLVQHEVRSVSAWLRTVMRNHCLMQLRTPKNMKTVEFKTDLVQSEENVHLNGVLEKEENFKKMEYCLGTLTKEQSEAIKLFYLEGKCYNEIVEMTGQEWNQVRSLIQNGRRNLKLCMEKTEP